MKKFLMLGAAALLLSTVGASAGQTTIIQLDKSFDTFRISQVPSITNEGALFGQVHFFGSHQVGAGVGMEAKTRYIPRGVMLTDAEESPEGFGVKYVCYDFQRPFKNGGKWNAYYSYDGRKVQWYGSGTYTVIGTVGR